MTEKLARICATHPWRAIAVWVFVVFLSIFAIQSFLASGLTTDGNNTDNPESKQAQVIIDKSFPKQDGPTELVVIRSEKYSINDSIFAKRTMELQSELQQTNVVKQLQSYFTSGNRDMVSSDLHAAFIAMEINASEKDSVDKLSAVVDKIVAVVKKYNGRDDFQVNITGKFTAGYDFQKLSQSDLKKGEFQIGLPAALIVLVLVFGALVGALIPLLLAILAIVVALGLTAIVGQQWQLSFFILNMLTAMGLALGIDYSLFIVSRFREERAAGKSKLDAITLAGATANRAVLFSGSAFILSMIGLLLVPSFVMRSLATGAILVSIVSVVSALTFLPALLSLLGDRVNSIRIPYFGRTINRRAGLESPYWSATIKRVIRRPLLSLVITLGALTTLATLALSMKTGASGVSTIPDSLISKQGYIAMQKSFPNAGNDPAEVVISGDVNSANIQGAIKSLQQAVDRDTSLGTPQLKVAASGQVALISIPVSVDAIDDQSIQAVQRLRNNYIPDAFANTPASVKVAGVTATNIDYFAAMNYWLPIVIAVVLILTFCLLIVAFRSIVIPTYSILLNLLSVGVAYGLIVAVFQKGFAINLLGFTKVPYIEAWVPLFLFAVLFGLSMDYQVFLLSRIKERFSQTKNTADAIIFGIGSTARIITGAALIIIVVFAGFATGEMVMFQQMGFGVGIALLVDATLVRLILVPAIMKILGKWNWYLPSWLSWLPHIEVESHKKS